MFDHTVGESLIFRKLLDTHSYRVAKHHTNSSGLVGAAGLLVELFPDPAERPTVRWVRDCQKRRTLPFYKIGRLVYFSVDEVRESLRKNLRVEARAS